MGTLSVLRQITPISGYQFATFRILFGLYLILHLASLLPYGAEIFSREGMLASARLNFTHGILPNPLEHWDSPGAVSAFLLVLLGLAVAYTAGVFRRSCAILLWFGWACLFNRNNLISNPSIPYVGLLLLLSAILPAGEPLRVRRGRGTRAWCFPAGVYWAAWFLMAIGYTFSGGVKLFSPSWIDGSALLHLVNNPLARPGVFRDLFLGLPELGWRLLTWGGLAMEILFLPLSFHRSTRPLAWSAMLSMHLGILLIVDFADLSFGMVMVHLFTFDPEWLPVRHGARGLVLYDGVCGLCDRTVQFLLDVDRHRVLTFAPLQGETAMSLLGSHNAITNNLESIIFVREYSTLNVATYRRSEAVLRILNEVGGFWRVVSWLRIIPRPLRDMVYDWIGRNRYRWFGKFAECRIPSAEVRARFLP